MGCEFGCRDGELFGYAEDLPRWRWVVSTCWGFYLNMLLWDYRSVYLKNSSDSNVILGFEYISVRSVDVVLCWDHGGVM